MRKREQVKKNCPTCDHRLILREYRNQEVKTTFGIVQKRSPYYHCRNCKKYGFFNDDVKNPDHGRLSKRMAEKVCLFAHQLTFETTSDLIERLINVKISTSTIKEVSESIGNKLYEEEAKLIESVGRLVLDEEIESETLENRAYLQIDGAMIHHLKEWKENKLGIMFSEKDIIHQGDGENARVSIKKKTLVSSFAQGVDEFKTRLRYWLIKSHTYCAREIIVISDGAVWIENLVNELIPNGKHILDWFHVKEKLWECAKKLFGDDSEKCKLWVTGFADRLWDGEVEEVLKDLWNAAMDREDQTPLLALHQYFGGRVKMMKYDQFRNEGLYIGSGAIESANKYAIQDRLKKAGMKWSTRGANAIAKLRTTYLSGQWDKTWQAA